MISRRPSSLEIDVVLVLAECDVALSVARDLYEFEQAFFGISASIVAVRFRRQVLFSIKASRWPSVVTIRALPSPRTNFAPESVKRDCLVRDGEGGVAG